VLSSAAKLKWGTAQTLAAFFKKSQSVNRKDTKVAAAYALHLPASPSQATRRTCAACNVPSRIPPVRRVLPGQLRGRNAREPPALVCRRQVKAVHHAQPRVLGQLSHGVHALGKHLGALVNQASLPSSCHSCGCAATEDTAGGRQQKHRSIQGPFPQLTHQGWG
jgi:hypothetical protein